MKRRQKRLILAVLALVMAGTGLWFLLRTDRYESGRVYLQAQEQKDLASIESAISKKKLDRLDQGLQDGSLSVFSLFNDGLILGDSRARGFADYGFVPPEKVLADIGGSITNLPGYVDAVKAAVPAWIYISYGINDVGHRMGQDTENGYAKICEENIKAIQEAAPQAHIVVNSIIHVSPTATSSQPDLAKVDGYNAQLKQMCEENGWIYVDNDTIDEGGNGNFYDGDGIHFYGNFYQVWAQNMASAVLTNRETL